VLTAVLEEGQADGSLTFTGTADDTSDVVLGALEGAMLITRLDGDVAQFTATTQRVLTGLTPSTSVPA